MSKTAADNLCERLIEWDVSTIYGFPGDGINGHPRRAAPPPGASCASCRRATRRWPRSWPAGTPSSPGEVGVCMATSGPGAIHLLNGLYDAKLDHQPVVAIVGQTFVRAIGGDFQQEVKLLQLYSDVASAFCEQANEPSTIRHLIDRAMRIAQTERTVTCVIVPADVQDMEAVRGTAARDPHGALRASATGPGGAFPSSHSSSRPPTSSTPGEKVAMLVGQGALRRDRRGDRGRRHARRRASPRRCWARRPCPTTCPSAPAAIGLLGTKPSWDMMQGADTLLMVGSSFPYSEFLPQEGPGQGGSDRPAGPHAEHPLPDGSRPGGRQQGEPQGAAAAAAPQGGPLLAGGDQEQRRRLVAADGRSGRARRPQRPDPAAGAVLARSRASCPTTRSSPATRARRPTGTHGRSASAAG